MSEIFNDPVMVYYSIFFAFEVLIAIGAFWDYKRQKNFVNVD